MTTFLPYIASVVCALISGLVTYSVAKRQMRAEIQKLERQHELDLETERQRFEMEKEKMELEHKHQMELRQKELENQLSVNLLSTMTTEYMKSPEAKAQMKQAANMSKNRPARR